MRDDAWFDAVDEILPIPVPIKDGAFYVVDGSGDSSRIEVNDNFLVAWKAAVPKNDVLQIRRADSSSVDKMDPAGEWMTTRLSLGAVESDPFGLVRPETRWNGNPLVSGEILLEVTSAPFGDVRVVMRLVSGVMSIGPVFGPTDAFHSSIVAPFHEDVPLSVELRW